MPDPVLAPVVAPPVVDPAAPPVVAPVVTELGGTPPVVEPKVEEPKLGADGKPIVEPKLGPDGKPLAVEAPVVFDAAKLTLPEGMKSDDPLFQEFTGALADDKLDPQARGQKILDVYTKGVKAIQDANTAAWNTMNDNWVKAVKADPEIGGTKFEPTKATIAKAIDSFGPELSVAFRQGLDATGAGNHPAIWKGLAKMAALLTEGGHVSGKPPGAMAPSIKEAFYPNSPDMK